MKENITPAEMIQWFRSKANEFNNIADGLESTFSPSGQPIVKTQPATTAQSDSVKKPNVEDVKTALTKFGKPSRSSLIAKSINADPSVVSMILSSFPNIFEQVGRGWWQNKTISTEH
jgi:hypothetical protein